VLRISTEGAAASLREASVAVCILQEDSIAPPSQDGTYMRDKNVPQGLESKRAMSNKLLDIEVNSEHTITGSNSIEAMDGSCRIVLTIRFMKGTIGEPLDSHKILSSPRCCALRADSETVPASKPT